MAEIVVPFNRLTPKQKEIVEASTASSKSFFVEGPPGSGKTCISLHIVQSMIGKKVIKPLMLVYNNSLLGYMRSAYRSIGNYR
jgi:superfamily II DNA or RNA helicase